MPTIHEKYERLKAAAEELAEVVTLRGEGMYLDPCDDPLPWTARRNEAWLALYNALHPDTFDEIADGTTLRQQDVLLKLLIRQENHPDKLDRGFGFSHPREGNCIRATLIPKGLVRQQSGSAYKHYWILTEIGIEVARILRGRRACPRP